MTETKWTCVIVDIDGTVAARGSRYPFDYHAAISDKPRTNVIAAVKAVAEHNNADVMFVSGRDESCRDTTVAWLKQHCSDIFNEDLLFMRPAGNYEPDTVIKKRILHNDILPKYDVVAVFDDRPSVVDMWHDEGFMVFAVADQRKKF